MYSWIFTVLFVLFFLSSAVSEPFKDLSGNKWASDAVNVLQEKGFVEGYPDGFFKGDRPLGRYEMAMIVARVIAKVEILKASIPSSPDVANYISRGDMEIINKLIDEFHKELADIGVKIDNIELSLSYLENRTDLLERVFISGDMTTVANSLGFTKEPPPEMPMVFEEFGGFGLTQGNDVSSKLNLNTGINIDENTVAGATFTAYSFLGTPGVTYFWGLLPSFCPAGINSETMFNNGINFYSSVNKLWFKTSGDWEVSGTFGEYQPEKISPLVYYGIVGPSAWSPDAMPLCGINLNGKVYGHYKFEIIEADDLTWPGSPTHVFTGDSPYDLYSSDYYQTPDNQGYHSRMYGFLGGYENDRFDFDCTCLRIYEDRASRPESVLIPKDEIIFDLRGTYRILDDKLKLSGEFARSWFNCNLLDPSSSGKGGNAILLGGEGVLSGFDYDVKYIRIDGNYEPFGFHKIFTNTDYGAYIMSFYTPNRTGFYSKIGYNFDDEKGRLEGTVAYLKQLDPTDPENNPFTIIGGPDGFQDHYFHNPSGDKGREFYLEFGGHYKVTDKFCLEGHVLSINFDRTYSDYIHNQNRNFYFISADYHITDDFIFSGVYRAATVKGIDDDGFDSDIVLHIPGVSLSYNLSEDTSVSLDYRYYNHEDALDSEDEYALNRVTTWMKISF